MKTTHRHQNLANRLKDDLRAIELDVLTTLVVIENLACVRREKKPRALSPRGIVLESQAIAMNARRRGRRTAEVPSGKYANRPGTKRRYVPAQIRLIPGHLFHFGDCGIVERGLCPHLF